MKYLAYPHENGVMSALYGDERVLEFDYSPKGDGLTPGSIYVGTVKHLVAGLEAAFVEIGGVSTFYSLKENPNSIFLTPGNHDRVKEGDLILIQVEREAVKTKQPVVTSKLTLQGRYLAMVRTVPGLAFSSRITGEEMRAWKEEVRAAFSDWSFDEYGFIVRTNAAGADPMEIRADAEALEIWRKALLQRGACLSAGACVMEAPDTWIKDLCDAPRAELTEIVIEDKTLYEQAKEQLRLTAPELLPRLRLYEDSFPLKKLFRLEKALSEALEERVWLKSGGYLVIQPTEALTVIDVNTGKQDTRKGREEGFFLTNREAAAEIAAQLRLRNLSGIIIVDFIDMESQEHRTALLELFKECLKDDPMRAKLVDMTPLGLVELTRRRIKRPLAEQLRKRQRQ